MTHALHLPVLLVIVAVVGLSVVGIITFLKKRSPEPVEPDFDEVQRIQDRLASSRIARRASGSRRKVVAIRPPADEEPAKTDELVKTDTAKMPVAEAAEPPAEDTAGH